MHRDERSLDLARGWRPRHPPPLFWILLSPGFQARPHSSLVKSCELSVLPFNQAKDGPALPRRRHISPFYPLVQGIRNGVYPDLRLRWLIPGAMEPRRRRPL